ncbi:MAG: type I-F CRISPR-associated protein Csy3 [Sulfuricellaceae bacterium]
MTALTTLKKLPGVLAFNRGHVVTDGEMFNEIAGQYETHPVEVVRHGIRGTQNVNDGKGNIDPWSKVTGSSDSASNGVRNPSNIQITETAKLESSADALVVRFGLSMLDMAGSLDSCVAADKDAGRMMRATFEDFVNRAKASKGINEVARRYARNIANGRWLWRNRTIARLIEIEVSNQGGVLAKFNDAKAIPTNTFGDYSEGEIKVADEIVKQMRGASLDGLTVVARLTMPTKGAIEVFPSQNYVENKPKGFARPLYKLGHPEKIGHGEIRDTRVMGRAALRDQKIFNAIRTMDTWYPAYEETGFPIAVEPLGASLGQQEFYRAGKASSFDMLKRLAQIAPDSPEGMFCIAALDRGGVYGESGQLN